MTPARRGSGPPGLSNSGWTHLQGVQPDVSRGVRPRDLADGGWRQPDVYAETPPPA